MIMIILLFKIKFLLSTHIASLRYETVFDGLKFSDARLTGLTVILMFVLIDNIVNFLMVVVLCLLFNRAYCCKCCLFYILKFCYT